MSLCASAYMCFVVTCWERADLLALVCGVCCEFVTFPLVSWVRCGTWLYRFLIFAPLITMQIVNDFVWILFVVMYMKVVYLTTKSIQIKPYAICSSHQLGLEVKDQSGALHSPFFNMLHDKRNTLSFKLIFSASIYRAVNSVYEVSYQNDHNWKQFGRNVQSRSKWWNAKNSQSFTRPVIREISP